MLKVARGYVSGRRRDCLAVTRLRRSPHNVTGLWGFCALNSLGLENFAIVPTTSPCNPSLYTLNGRLRSAVRHPGFKVLTSRGSMVPRHFIGVSDRLIYPRQLLILQGTSPKKVCGHLVRGLQYSFRAGAWKNRAFPDSSVDESAKKQAL